MAHLTCPKLCFEVSQLSCTKSSPYNFKDPIIPKGPGADTKMPQHRRPHLSLTSALGVDCGAVSLAASLSGAKEVIANDIDKTVKIALTANCE